MKIPSQMALCGLLSARRSLVTLHGHRGPTPRLSTHTTLAPPPDPQTLLTPSELADQVQRLSDWIASKRSVLCLTGAGLSTESGIPDYRGSNGSYHRGHQPMRHDQFMSSESQRQRYWGRSMVGYSSFRYTSPNAGHHALAQMEHRGWLGVAVEDGPDLHPHPDDYAFSSGQRQVSVVTQNVDSLHRRANTRHVVELHGRADQVVCMDCGWRRDRDSFQEELADVNREWLDGALAEVDTQLRPDGDANLQREDYSAVRIPPCVRCGGFCKPDVVFFGDTVPKHRVNLVRAAVDQSDGILVVGSSLAVHSAYRHVRHAVQQGIPVAILNVGQTRPELEGIGVDKFEAPAGPALEGVINELEASHVR